MTFIWSQSQGIYLNVSWAADGALGLLLTDFIRDLFVAIQMTEFLHNNDDCHSSRDMIHPTVGIIVYSKIVQSHLAWRPTNVCLACTRHIRSWIKPLCWVFICLCWEMPGLWFWVSPAAGAGVINLRPELWISTRRCDGGQSGPTLLTCCITFIWIASQILLAKCLSRPHTMMVSNSVSMLQDSVRALLSSYLARFSVLAGPLVTCGPVLSWLEVDNRGNRWVSIWWGCR